MLSHGVAIMPVYYYGAYIMASTRLTFGAAMSTITDTLTVVSTVANVATKSVGMLDTFVSNAAQNQATRAKLEQASTITRLIDETALADTQREQKIEEYLDKNPGTADKFREHQERLRKLLEESK